MSLKKTFRATPGLISREIAGEFILVPTGNIALEIHGMIALSESGKLLWDKLKSSCTEEELVKIILETYDVDSNTAWMDVRDFLMRMSQLGILEIVNDEVERKE